MAKKYFHKNKVSLKVFSTETITISNVIENIETLYSTQEAAGSSDRMYGLVSITYSLGRVLYDSFSNTSFLSIEPLAEILSLDNKEENTLFYTYTEMAKTAIKKANPNGAKFYEQVPSKRKYMEALMLSQIHNKEAEQTEILTRFLKNNSQGEDITPLLEFRKRFFEWLEEQGEANTFENSPLRNTPSDSDAAPFQDIPLDTAEDIMLRHINSLNISVDYKKLKEFHEKLTNYEIIDGNEFKFESMLWCVMCGNFPNWDFLIYMSPGKLSDSQKKVFVYLLSQSDAIRPHIKWADKVASRFNCDFSACQQYFGKIVDSNVLLFCEKMKIPLSEKQKNMLSILKAS